MFEELYAPVLHIPEGVNFDCTGCGNCCFTWPVPCTDADVERISAFTTGAEKPKFKKLGAANLEKLQGFTHVLGKAGDGYCQYLDNLRCALHVRYGADAKPAMCQLFPYTFTLTPTGAYAALSFASSGVLLNHGTALSQQRAFLEDRLKLFLQLFPAEPDWGNIQLIDGVACSWIDYLFLERELLARLQPNQIEVDVSACLLDCSASIVNKSSLGRADLEHEKMIKAKPEFIDAVLTLLLMEMYFPNNAFNESVCHWNTDKFKKLLSGQLPTPALQFGGRQFLLSELSGKRIGGSKNHLDERLENDVDELLRRFIYCRVFAKLYFGPGFNGLSILSGFHHLLLLRSLCRLRLKMRLACGTAEDRLMDDLREDLRLMERRLTVTSLSREAHAAMEVLLQGPERTKRIVLAAS